MPPSYALRALVALAAGWAMGDCVLFAAALLLWSAHLHGGWQIAGDDRAHAWLRVVAQGIGLIALGAALAAHTVAVYLGAWTGQNGMPWLAALFVLLLGLPGPSPAPVPWMRHATVVLALLAVLAPPLASIGWTPCAFAAATVLFAWGYGVYQLGPLARELAVPWRSR